ncbi:sigma-54-dependent Fis family transcriptional regulator [Undibacterium jejuense]|uniref:Sigma-54-dependent Fis family transcriptional regulator n=1 Tax=Undibacterium jejuense TaxID=1344949 RepID=A0A923HGX1_9BURK|nr:sigma-54 dependent transcriptional regulator [Undibacterium jejuense]MBC3861407.1 sigma-54-dependent Fis family transcriptional regulator [Undibacterium jejuense]
MSATSATACPRILVVDDEAHLRELLEITLIKMGLDVDSAENISHARSYLAQKTYSLVLTDMRLPDGSGMELVAEVNALYKTTPIAVITAFGSADNAVVALKAGAFDYVSKPVALDQLRKLVRSALDMNEVALKAQPMTEVTPIIPDSFLIGRSAGMQAVREQIGRLARSMAPVIITGESGSGKELAAREIHFRSARANKPFIAVNCGAIPETLMEAEFFGYRKGAFTGAADDREGFFQAANGGTLMLDEVADLPLAMQVKLLRAIQERSIRKVGATIEEAVDVRIISATHQNLSKCVAEGRFRQDLYYRLNVIELHLPPLRERLEDIADLSAAILNKLGADGIRISDAALYALSGYDFPGNVRELENILERALAFANDSCIQVVDLAMRGTQKIAHPLLEVSPIATLVPAESAPLPPIASLLSSTDLPCSLPAFLESVETEMIRRALLQTNNNRTQAAELLGISFRQLRYQIQKLKIQD